MRPLPPSSRKVHLLALAAAWLVVAAAAVPVAASQRQADFRADVELVRLNVAVVNPSGGEVPALSEADFTVYDDGVLQQVELFLRPDDTPLEVALVLDSSTSMRPVAGSSRRAALTFLSQLDPDDCVLVLPFSERVRAGRRGPAVDPGLRLFIDGVVAGGGTALHDALLRGLDELDRPPAAAPDPPAGPPAGGGSAAEADARPPRGSSGAGSLKGQLGRVADDIAAGASSIAGSCPATENAGAGETAERRKAIVLLSDGADEDSDAGFDEVLGAARQASVPVFPVAFGYAHQDSRLAARLTELARATGGRRLQSATPERLRAAYAEALEYLRASYVLGYHPGPRGAAGRGAGKADREGDAGRRPGGLGWHEVRVELRRPLLEAIVRPGYYR